MAKKTAARASKATKPADDPKVEKPEDAQNSSEAAAGDDTSEAPTEDETGSDAANAGDDGGDSAEEPCEPAISPEQEELICQLAREIYIETCATAGRDFNPEHYVKRAHCLARAFVLHDHSAEE